MTKVKARNERRTGRRNERRSWIKNEMHKNKKAHESRVMCSSMSIYVVYKALSTLYSCTAVSRMYGVSPMQWRITNNRNRLTSLSFKFDASTLYSILTHYNRTAHDASNTTPLCSDRAEIGNGTSHIPLTQHTVRVVMTECDACTNPIQASSQRRDPDHIKGVASHEPPFGSEASDLAARSPRRYAMHARIAVRPTGSWSVHASAMAGISISNHHVHAQTTTTLPFLHAGLGAFRPPRPDWKAAQGRGQRSRFATLANLPECALPAFPTTLSSAAS